MKHDDSQSTLWALSYLQLAARCREIAEDSTETIDKTLQGEASRLCAAWQNAFAMPDSGFDEHARRAAHQAGLRKRTIEILLKVFVIDE